MAGVAAIKSDDADASAVPVESRAKCVGVEALVADRAFTAAQDRKESLDGFEVMARSGRQIEGDRPARPSETAASLVLNPPLVRPIG